MEKDIKEKVKIIKIVRDIETDEVKSAEEIEGDEKIHLPQENTDKD